MSACAAIAAAMLSAGSFAIVATLTVKLRRMRGDCSADG